MHAVPEHPSGHAERARGLRCPTCGTRRPWLGNVDRPFCSQVCRLIDLGQWLDERYRIQPEPAAGEPGGDAR
jgi:endogenous inhibitor of DNA gyrase (YacG/DUF329 family)